MRRRSPSFSPPRRGYGGRARSPPRGRYGGYGGRREPNTSLLVRNIPRDCRADELRIPFERFGPLKDIYLPKDYYTGGEHSDCKSKTGSLGNIEGMKGDGIWELVCPLVAYRPLLRIACKEGCLGAMDDIGHLIMLGLVLSRGLLDIAQDHTHQHQGGNLITLLHHPLEEVGKNTIDPQATHMAETMAAHLSGGLILRNALEMLRGDPQAMVIVTLYRALHPLGENLGHHLWLLEDGASQPLLARLPDHFQVPVQGLPISHQGINGQIGSPHECLSCTTLFAFSFGTGRSLD
eukprot:Gb_06441 [translate_table: standard]